MPGPSAHPDPRVLADFAIGRLPWSDFEAVAMHLDQCGPCRATVASAPGDRLIALLRRDPAVPSPDRARDDAPASPGAPR